MLVTRAWRISLVQNDMSGADFLDALKIDCEPCGHLLFSKSPGFQEPSNAACCGP